MYHDISILIIEDIEDQSLKTYIQIPSDTSAMVGLSAMFSMGDDYEKPLTEMILKEDCRLRDFPAGKCTKLS